MGWRLRRTAAVIGFTASAHFRGLSRAASTQTRGTLALRSSGILRPRIGGLGIRDRLGHHPAAGRRSHSSRIFRLCAGLDRDDLRLGCPSGSVDPLGEARQAARIPCLLDSALLPFESAQCALRRPERALPDRGRAMIQASTLHLVVALIGALALVTLALAVFLPEAAAGRHCSESRTENEPKLSSLAARVPISEIRDGLIVRKDGSFCAGWECSGIATQFASAERLEAVSSALDAFIKGIRHPEIELQFRYVIDYETSRVLEARKALGCANSPGAWLEDNRLSFWRSAIDAGHMRSIRLLAFLSWKPKRTWETRSAASRFAAAFWQGLIQDGLGKLPSVFGSASKPSLRFAGSVSQGWLNWSITH